MGGTMTLPLPTFTRLGLVCGLAVPILYFGVQVLAAPFFPGYSFVTDAASLLGSDQAPNPAIFNTGAMLTGLASWLAGYGYAQALTARRVRSGWIWLIVLALTLNGTFTLWAGLYPLPDPRHDAGPLSIIGLLLFPALLALSFWGQPDARPLKVYLGLVCLAVLILVPIMSTAAGLDLIPYEGLRQRVVTLVLFPPVGLGALFLLHPRAPG